MLLLLFTRAIRVSSKLFCRAIIAFWWDGGREAMLNVVAEGDGEAGRVDAVRGGEPSPSCKKGVISYACTGRLPARRWGDSPRGICNRLARLCFSLRQRKKTVMMRAMMAIAPIIPPTMVPVL